MISKLSSKNDIKKALKLIKTLSVYDIKLSDWDDYGNYEVTANDEKKWYTEQELIDRLIGLQLKRV